MEQLKDTRWTRAALALLVGGAALHAEQVSAQQGAEPAPADSAAAAAPAARQRTDKIEEIIVTAQRRSENIQTVPVAVTAISADTLQQRVFNDPSQVQLLAPSLQSNGVSAAPGIANYSIRGVGTASFSNAIEYSVSTVIDDVVLARPEMGALQYSDVDRIEVLRGPQGMLFGKNASAGVINIVTSRPEIGKYEGSARFILSDSNTPDGRIGGQVHGLVNVPVSTDSALRISGFGSYQPPLVKNILPNNASQLDMKMGGAKLKYLWIPNSRLTVYAAADYGQEKGAGSGALSFRAIPQSSPLAAPARAIGIVPGPGNEENAANGPYTSKYDVGGAQLNASYKLDNGFLVSNILAYRFYHLRALADSDLLQTNFFDKNGTNIDDTQLSEELRLTSPRGGLVEGQVGVYLYKGRFSRRSDLGATLGSTTLPPGFVTRGGTSDALQDAQSGALFGQGTVRLADGLRLIAGARQTYDKIDLNVVAAQGNSNIAFFGNGSLKQHASNSNLSYKTGLQYDLARDVMAYATYTRGYKGPAFNSTVNPALALPVGPEIPVAAEVGIKSTWFERRLQLNVAAFNETFHGYQAAALDLVLLQPVLLNAGSVQSRGLEVDVKVKPAAGLTLGGALTYNRANYDNFPGVPCYVGQPGCTANGPFRTIDISGKQLVNAPRLTGNLSAQYEWGLTRDLEGLLSVSGYGRSRANFSANGDPGTAQPGYGLLDASFAVYPDSGKWRLSVFARNLFDRRFAAAIQTNVASTVAYQQAFNLNSYRTLGVTFDIGF